VYFGLSAWMIRSHSSQIFRRMRATRVVSDLIESPTPRHRTSDEQQGSNRRRSLKEAAGADRLKRRVLQVGNASLRRAFAHAGGTGKELIEDCQLAQPYERSWKWLHIVNFG
jgi:hypothetical protein